MLLVEKQKLAAGAEACDWWTEPIQQCLSCTGLSGIWTIKRHSVRKTPLPWTLSRTLLHRHVYFRLAIGISNPDGKYFFVQENLYRDYFVFYSALWRHLKEILNMFSEETSVQSGFSEFWCSCHAHKASLL